MIAKEEEEEEEYKLCLTLSLIGELLGMRRMLTVCYSCGNLVPFFEPC